MSNLDIIAIEIDKFDDINDRVSVCVTFNDSEYDVELSTRRWDPSDLRDLRHAEELLEDLGVSEAEFLTHPQLINAVVEFVEPIYEKTYEAEQLAADPNCVELGSRWHRALAADDKFYEIYVPEDGVGYPIVREISEQEYDDLIEQYDI